MQKRYPNQTAYFGEVLSIPVTVSYGTTFTLNIDTNPMGSSETTPSVGSYIYSEDEIVSISAGPYLGYQFDHWEGDVEDPFSENTTVLMNADKTIAAVFRSVPTYFLNITEVNPEGAGTTFPAAGAHPYSEGEVVAITATANPGYRFVSWTGAVIRSCCCKHDSDHGCGQDRDGQLCGGTGLHPERRCRSGGGREHRTGSRGPP